MEFEIAKTHFECRYLRWALAQAADELQLGFPSLSSFKHGPAVKLIERLNGMPVPDRLGYWTALIKYRLARQRFRVSAIEKSQEPTPNEQAIAEQYAKNILQRSPSELVREAEARNNPGLFRISRKELKRLIKGKFESHDWAAKSDENSSAWRYVTQVSGVKLTTTFDVGSRLHELTYTQSVAAHTNAYLKDSIAVLSWLGISGQTNWTHIRSDELDVVAESAVELCLRFRDVLAAIVAGLPGLEKKDGKD